MKITIESKAKTLDFYITNYCKLIDSDLDWFDKYLFYKLEGNLVKAKEIETTYLQPIQQKLNSLVSRALKETSNE